ncbi:50S ribosomal protein L7ae [archaeon]|nr:50S ribosomal protein L7ae [archaeon]
MAKKEFPKDVVESAYKAVEMARDTGKLKRGVNETTKAIERGQAKLAVVAEDVEPPEIVAHIPLLAKEKNAPCVIVPSRKNLGTASGIDVQTSSVAITDAGNAKELVEEIAKKLEKI